MRGAVTLAALGAGLYLVMRDDHSQAPEGETPEYVESGELLNLLVPGATQKDDPLFRGENTPRGIRNNNPGNIEKGAAWKGLSEDQSQDDRFAVFSDAKWGIRAMARVLDTYRERHGLDTVKGIINRWAPSHENKTSAYAEHVAQVVGVAPTDPLPDDTGTRVALIKALVEHENGYNPYPDRLIRQGVRLA